MDNILNFPGSEPKQEVLVPEKEQEEVDRVQEVLSKIKDVDFEDIIIIGTNSENMLGFATSFENGSDIVYLLEKLKIAILSGN